MDTLGWFFVTAMIEVVFFLKFHHQIKRTRPAVFSFLEKAVTEQAEASGAKVRQERRFIIARFNDNAPALALDLLLLVEKILGTVAAVSSDIYGWKAALFRENSGGTLSPPSALFRALSIKTEDADDEKVTDGIWCHDSLCGELEPFIQFGEPLHFEQEGSTIYDGDFLPIILIKPVKKQDCRFPMKKKIMPFLEEKRSENCLIVAPAFSGKSESVELFAGGGSEKSEGGFGNDFPPLVICFGPESAGLGCLAASLTREIETVLKVHISDSDMNNLLLLSTIINRQFLCREMSSYLFENAQVFFKVLLSYYFISADNLKKRPLILLENIQNAAVQATKIFFSAFSAVEGKSSPTVWGTSITKEISAEWRGLFKHIFSIQSSGTSQQPAEFLSALPRALCEIAYMVYLFKKYFPPNALKILFYEEGKNELFLERAFSMLEDYGIIRSRENPKMLIPGFEKTAVTILGERSIFIKNIISRRLYVWLSDGRLRITFDLIAALHELGKDIDDRLLLDSVINDVTNGTFLFVKKNIKNGMFDRICGEERASSLRFVFETLKVLLFGNDRDVKNVFMSIENKRKGQKTQIPLYQAEEYSITALYRLGINDKTAALEAAKKSVMLNQGVPNAASLSRVYRIMALVNLSNGRLSDTMDYIAFASDNAIKNNDHDELALSGYYASGAHYLFGNISKANRLINLAKKSASISGRMAWHTRIVFFEGRIMFETGYYEKALSLFEHLLEEMNGKVETNAYQTISAWAYRCKIFLNGVPEGEYIRHNTDFLLFEIEACYFAGDYESAARKAAAFMEHIPEPAFQFVEQPDWSSGFSGIEFILFDKRDFLLRFATAYRCLSVCCIDTLNAAEAAHDMEYLMRNERFNGADPNNPFLFYAYFQVLDKANAPEVDKNTAISMAFKCLQSRASRIDDLDTKRNFLRLPFWNKVLYQTSKDYKLI
jgi:tetratricopeptide (TPR) repeat protein